MDKYPFIDIERIGAGVYNLLGKDHKASIALGIIPADVVGLIQEQVDVRLTSFPHMVNKATIKQFSTDIGNEICSNIYSQAIRRGEIVKQCFSTKTTIG